MANMAEVNKSIKANCPNLDIEAVRGEGYVYFSSENHTIDSVFAHPVTTSTSSMIDLVLEQIQEYISKNNIQPY